MRRRFIGESIGDAIDWTQDTLGSTRPIAETVLFSLLADKKAKETEDGFILLEADDDDNHDEIKRRHASHRPRFRFHQARTRETHKMRTTRQRLGFSDVAEGMMNPPDKDKS